MYEVITVNDGSEVIEIVSVTHEVIEIGGQQGPPGPPGNSVPVQDVEVVGTQNFLASYLLERGA